MDTLEYISLIFERLDHVESTWTSYGAFGVVLIGWLIHMKGELLLRHKVIATLIISIICLFFFGRHFTAINDATAICQDLTLKLEDRENDVKNILSEFSSLGDSSSSFSWIIHTIFFLFFSALVWVEKLWGNKMSLNKSTQPTANASAD